MTKIIFNIDCSYKNKKYMSGQELKNFKKEDLSTIWKLNEKGIIKPISKDEMIELTNSFSKKNKSEVDK